MNRRSTDAVHEKVTASLVAAFVACGLLLAVFAHAESNPSLGPNPFSGFTDDLGHRVDGHTLQRPLRLVFFGYTSCPDVCPLTLLAVHQALQTLGTQADRIDPMFVTVDPDRDTVARLHSYVGAFDARIHGYRAKSRHLNRLTAPLNVRYWREVLSGPTDYAVSHTSTLFLVSRSGELLARIRYYRDPSTLSEEILSTVRPFIESGSANERGDH